MKLPSPYKTNHTTFRDHCTRPLQWPTPYGVLLSKSEQIHLLPIAVSLSELFRNETSRARASLVPKTRHHAFWPGSSPNQI